MDNRTPYAIKYPRCRLEIHQERFRRNIDGVEYWFGRCLNCGFHIRFGMAEHEFEKHIADSIERYLPHVPPIALPKELLTEINPDIGKETGMPAGYCSNCKGIVNMVQRGHDYNCRHCGTMIASFRKHMDVPPTPIVMDKMYKLGEEAMGSRTESRVRGEWVQKSVIHTGLKKGTTYRTGVNSNGDIIVEEFVYKRRSPVNITERLVPKLVKSKRSPGYYIKLMDGDTCVMSLGLEVEPVLKGRGKAKTIKLASKDGYNIVKPRGASMSFVVTKED